MLVLKQLKVDVHVAELVALDQVSLGDELVGAEHLVHLAPDYVLDWCFDVVIVDVRVRVEDLDCLLAVKVGL